MKAPMPRTFPLPDPPLYVPEADDEEEMAIRKAVLDYRAIDPIYTPPEENP